MMSTEIEQDEPSTIIKIIGIGNEGICFIENLINSGLSGPEFIVAGTDVAVMAESRAAIKIQLGKSEFRSDVEPDAASWAETKSQGVIEVALAGTHMLIIEGDISDESERGAASVIAHIARNMGIFTVALVRPPFSSDLRSQRIYEAGATNLVKHVDSLIPIWPESLRGKERLETDDDMLFTEFDEWITIVVTGLCSLLLRVSLVCVDLEDVRTVMGDMALGAVGIGSAAGEGRAKRAAEQAVNSASLGSKRLGAACGFLVQIWSSDKAPNRVRMKEVNEVMNSVKSHAAKEAHVIFGTVYANLGDSLRVVVIACGTE